jgi:hypothetical protein
MLRNAARLDPDRAAKAIATLKAIMEKSGEEPEAGL